jgi:hypothetical protein
MRRAAPWLVLALAEVALAALFVGDGAGAGAAWAGLPLDDGWIHLVYARSLGSGHGLAYNVGQPETGFTSPLWVMLLAPLFTVGVAGHAAALAAKLAGVALGVAGSALLHRLTLRLTDSRAAAWTAAWLYALEPALAFARVSGMEVTLATVVTLAALLALGDGRPRRAGAWLALAPLARPELAVLTAIALPLVVAQLRRQKADRRAYTATLAPIALAALAWSGYCLAVTGHPLPATFYAKHVAGGAFSDAGTLAQMVTHLALFGHGAGALAAAWGALVLARRRGAGLVIVLAAIALPLAILWAHRLEQWQPFYWSRYVMIAIPLWLLLLAAPVATLAAWLRARRPRALAAVALAVAVAWPWPRALAAAADRYARNCRDVERMQVAAGRFVAAHAAPDDAVATNDAGAIRFFGERRTIDLIGLNSHAVLFGDARVVVAREQPRFVIVFPEWYPPALRDPRFRLVARFGSDDYSICDCPRQHELVVLERVAPY